MNRRFILFFIEWMAFSFAPRGAGAEPPIIIRTASSSLVLQVGDDKKIYQTYYGSSLLNSREYASLPLSQEVYIPSGTDNLFEPAIRITHTDGDPSLDLRFLDSRQLETTPDITLTKIRLKDPVHSFYVTLCFRSYSLENIIEAWTEIRNEEGLPVVLNAYASCMLHLNASAYWLTQFHGDWFSEMHMEENQLSGGIKILDSKLGTKTNNYQSQVFMLSENKPASEKEGEVIAGTLAWTGNFRYSFEKDNHQSLRIIAGINPFASDYPLKSDSTFITPPFLFTHSEQGKGEASRNFQHWAIRYGILDGKGNREILLNNWESTFFDFDEPKLSELIREASQAGLDLFLLDDGWFGNKYPRSNDGSSLGDWQVTKAKLPHGISYLIKQVAENNIHFGIWIEPEMVNPRSELYENHPEWILKLPNRPEDLSRNQLVLDLTNPKVKDFIYNTIDSLLERNPGLNYLKWDCNRYMTDAWSPYLGKIQSRLFVDYTMGFYEILKRLRKKYPTLPMMLCSSGGGRVDYGALKYFTEFWPSDNTDAYDRIFIQWGYSYFFPSLAVCSHVTSAGNYSLKFKTDVAMSGKLGYDIKMNEFSAVEKEFTTTAIANYKRLRELIWHGDLYRLVSPYEGEHALFMHVDSAKNKAIIFSYNLHTPYFGKTNNTLLEGLDPVKTYKVEEINLVPATSSSFDFNGKSLSGDFLMKIGLKISLNQALTSHILELTEVN